MEIKKKTWPEHFQRILNGEKNFDLRLADFELKKGDIIIFEEYNPITKKYTGRTIKKIVKNLAKFNPAKAHSFDEISKFGFYEIEI